jgi:diguanylate cyclase (GGDEF)-like protein
MAADNPITTPQLRVLVVDDDSAIRTLYRTYLLRQHCFCEVAASGREALLVLMKQNFDVLIVDLRMENMDGLVFLQEALNIWPWLAVVISSGFVTEKAAHAIAQLGITRVLNKNEKMGVLLDNVFSAAAERHAAMGSVVEDDTLRLMRAHMRMMERLTKNHAEMDVLVEELSEFGRLLAEMLSAEASGILIYTKDKKTLLLAARSSLHPDFSAHVGQEMVTRFNVLSGHTITIDDVHLELKNFDENREVPTRPGKVTTVPIIMGDEIGGILTLAATDATAYKPKEISLLYHAANQVSALFTTLQTIHSLAAHDALTGLYNRLRMNEELSRSWEICQRHDNQMGVVMLDMDGLKAVNDTYGHAAGDDVLCEFATILTNAARGSDIVARYGGDEFVIIIPHLQQEGTQALAERIVKRTREHTFLEETLKLALSVTVGIATTSSEYETDHAETLLRRADQALYVAKHSGRDRIQTWEA